MKAGVHPLSAAVVGGCLVLTGGLATVANVVNAHSNHRLLVQQVQQAAVALSIALPVVQSELVDAAQVAIDTNGDPVVFQRFVTASLARTSSTTTMSLWQIDGGTARPVSSTGALTLVEQGLDKKFFATLKPGGQLFITSILPGTPARLGFAEMPTNDTAGYVVYGEAPLTPTKQVTIPPTSPFADLKVALYLGPNPTNAALLEATDTTPIEGQTAQTSLPLGNTVVTLVGASTKPLAGGLSNALAWIVAGAGFVLAIAIGWIVEYAIRRRLHAESLARDNDRLYREQRDIAGTLQHALLPQLPAVQGLDVAARYVAGVAGLEVGGDWYDVIGTDDDRCVFFVGDVSGSGLNAAALMASLRYAARAYIAQGDSIQTVLVKLSELHDIERDEHFATVLAGDIDVVGRRVTLVSAGHFAPLLVSDGLTQFLDVPVEPPIGVARISEPRAVTYEVPPGSTLIAFTDGLVERRGESIDEGLMRLRHAAGSEFSESSESAAVVDTLTTRLITDTAPDDTIVLAIRWQGVAAAIPEEAGPALLTA
ncbi:MAG TPA: PP2C family protein-serine/threonine phosphatase [Acidothermaceae bacterium]